MRKLILIAAVALLATEAHAGGSRSLSLAAVNANQPAAEQPATPAPTAAQPASVQTAATAPSATAPVTTAQTPATPPAAAAPAQSTPAPVASTTETTRPKHRQPSVEARVIRELHRHGIYW